MRHSPALAMLAIVGLVGCVARNPAAAGEAAQPRAAVAVATPAATGHPAGCRVIGTYAGVAFYRSDAGYVSFRADVDVNTDGALQSYKTDDLGYFDHRLHTHSALNTICNGVNVRDSSGAKLYDLHTCSKLIPEFERIRSFGWIKSGENYVQFYAIPVKPGTEGHHPGEGLPCEKDGYYVSQTARAMDESRGVCDPERWIDALRIPAIVIPLDAKMKAEGVAVRDLAAVRLPGSGAWVGAIVGDTNSAAVGEGTVRLAMELRGEETPPANYDEVKALALPAADYVVFPGTAGLLAGLTNDDAADIAAKAAEQLLAHHLQGDTATCR